MVPPAPQDPLSIITRDWHVLEAKLGGMVPFDLQRPKLDPVLELVGGKVMNLNGHKVLYTRWEKGGTTYSLYQFCAEDFGIRGEIRRQVVRSRISPPSAACEVTVWTEGHCDYALARPR